MKKLTAMLLCAVTAFSLAACGSRDQETQSQTETQTEAQSKSTEEVNENSEDSQITTAEVSGNSNILIAYFGVPETDGTDTEAGASRVAVDGEVLGNNEYIAQIIQQETHS